MFFTVGNQWVFAALDEVDQQREVTGTVVDASGIPLIGVTISVVGQTTGTITDLDGGYRIGVPDSKVELQFSFIGFKSQKVVVGEKLVLNITLSEDLQNLEEVVVVGYGVQKKSHLTGSVTKVRTDGLEDIPISRIDQALQGRVAGVQIQNITSEVGEAPQIRVRGMGSVSADSSPLVIIDGFPVEGGLGVVNMNDVESIEVLKDAASAAIYGSRAANGVIIITTKGGTVDKPKYTFKTSWGVKNAYKKHDILNAREYVDLKVRDAVWLGRTQLENQDFAFHVMTNDTGWQDEALQIANIYNAQLGISGGKKGLKYYVSASYINDEGIMINNNYEKMNVRAKIDAELSKRVTVGVNLAPTYSKKEVPATNFIDFYRTPSWLPVRHTEETSALTNYAYAVGEYAHGAHFNNLEYSGTDPISGEYRENVKTSPFNTKNHNPRMIIDNENIKQNDYRLQTSAYVNINIIEGLDFKTSNGFDISYRETNRYRNMNAREDGAKNRGLYQNRLYVDLLSENTLTYQKKVNVDHDFNVMLGFSGETKKYNTAGILGFDFPTDRIHTLNAAGTIDQYEGSTLMTGTWKESESMMSVYARLVYSYKDRYLFSASMRYDGSSKFGEDNRWGAFPSVSLGWRVSEEKFMKDVNWIDQLKIRTSYGVTGTDKIENYANQDMLNSANYIFGTGNGNVVQGLSNNSVTLGNKALKWEQTNEFNLGLDLSMINNRIGLTLDYYYSKTKSLLFERQISSISGYKKFWTNLGRIRNKGLEIELTTYNIQDGDFTWNSSINLSTNSNKVLDLGGPDHLQNQGERQEYYRTIIGNPSIQFVGYKTIGVWTEELWNDKSNPRGNDDAVGGLRVLDANNDGVINEEDLVPIGNPFPDFTWGITNNFKYKGFDLSVLIQGVQGVNVWNGDVYYNETRKWNRPYVMNHYVSDEHPGDGRTPGYDKGIKIMKTDYGIQDASYIALRDITFGYTFSKKLIKKTGLTGLRLYSSIQNLGFWWNSSYKGINPEARYTSGAYASPLISGYQRGGFPLQRTFSFGIDINF